MDTRASIRPSRWLAHVGWMRALAGHLLVDPADVDDVVQDAFVAAWRRLGDELEDDGSDPRPLEPWLAGVVRNLARKRQRSAVRRSAHEQALAPLASVPTPEETAQRLDLQRILVEEVRSLEEPLRTTILLRYFEGRTSADIAAAGGVPEGTVRWRVKRGLLELRLRLDRRLGGREAWSALFLPFAPSGPGTPAASGGIAAATQSALVATGVQGVLCMSVLAKLATAASVLTVMAAVWWTSQDPGRRKALVDENAPVGGAAALVDAPPVAEPPRIAAGAREPAAAEPASSKASAETKPSGVAGSVPSVPPARVDVRFVDAEGGAWEGVRFEGRDLEPPLATTSSSDGRAELEIPWIWTGEPLVQATFVARRTGSATLALHAGISPGRTIHLGDVLLGPGARVLGRVVDLQGTLDLEGAQVGLSSVEIPEDDLARRSRHGSQAFDRVVTTKAERDGVFVLEGVAPGRWRLWARAEGSRYAWTAPFDIEAGRDVAGLEIELSALLDEDRIAGVVLDPDGEPVPGAKLTFAYSAESESGMSTDEADDRGRFDFLIWLDAPYGIVASDPEGRFDGAVASGVRPGTLNLEIRLRPKSFLDVRVKGPDGKRVEDATFEVSIEADGARVSEKPAASRSPDGSYRLPRPPVPFGLDVRAPGFRPRSLADLDPARLTPPLEVVLEPALLLRGRVVFEGRPASGARVLLRRRLTDEHVQWNGFECLVEPRVLAQATCGPDGTFELTCEVDPPVVVRASGTGLAPAELGPLDPTLARGELELELTRGGTLEGRVLVDEGRSAEGTIVGINRGDVAPRTMRAGPEGRFRFEGLTPGAWQVAVREQELQPGVITIMNSTGDAIGEPELEWSCEVQAGRTTLYDLDLRSR